MGAIQHYNFELYISQRLAASLDLHSSTQRFGVLEPGPSRMQEPFEVTPAVDGAAQQGGITIIIIIDVSTAS